MEDSSGAVVISLQRLRELEAAEFKLNRIKNYKKEHPEEHKKSSLDSYYRYKEVINEKRRAAYKAKKEAEAEAARAAQG
jgi:RPA family protein